jgi:hypothetical protein
MTDERMAAWIGCLGCHNEGVLNGQWISVEEASEENARIENEEIPLGADVLKGIATMEPLGEHSGRPVCKRCASDEFQVFDTEHLAGGRSQSWGEFYYLSSILSERDEYDQGQLLFVISNFHYGWDAKQIEEADAWNETFYVGFYSELSDLAYELVEGCISPDAELLGRPLIDWIDMDEVWRYTLQHDYITNATEGGHHVWLNG